MSKQPKITPFDELLKQVEEEFPKYFGGKKPKEAAKQLKKLEWDVTINGDKKLDVRALIDPESQQVVDVIGMRKSGSSYPLTQELRDAVKDKILERKDEWEDNWTDV